MRRNVCGTVQVRPHASSGANRSPAPLPVTMAPAAMGFAGTEEERSLLNPIVAGETGTPVSQVPDVADLLWGPMLRGTVVNLS